MKIHNINDLAKYFGTEVKDIERVLYKYTECGAWINWDDKKVTIGSIVEGSDAEYSKEFVFPIDSVMINLWLDELEDLTDQAWREANGEDEED